MVYLALPIWLIDRLKIRRYYSIFDRFTANDLQESLMFARLLSSGGTVLDVGANIGVLAKVFSRMLGEKGTVHSFEPVLYSYRILTSNIERAGLKNVRCYHCAIGGADGEAVIEVPSYDETPDSSFGKSGSSGRVRNYYSAHLVRNGNSHSSKSFRTTVPVRSLDSLMAGAPGRIALIKCDCDGFELDSILGAAAIIKRDRPPIFIDISIDLDATGSPTGRMTEFLRGLGYAPYLLQQEQLRLRTAGTAVASLFYLAPEHVELLRPWIAEADSESISAAMRADSPK